MKLVLVCPVCGHAEWSYVGGGDDEGLFECLSCGEQVFPEDMEARDEDDIEK